MSTRWMICALLFAATTINYMDRQILSLLKPILDDQLHWTNAQFGLVNSAFQGAYALSLLFFGWFVDRFGTKLGYAVSIAGWSLAAMAHSLASTLGGFFYSRILLGLGEGGNFPAAIKTVAEWFPQRERALATGIFNSGSNVGAILAPAIVPWMALSFGWQSTFLAAGTAGFVWLCFWIPRRGFNSVPKPAPTDRVRIPWSGLFGYRQTWAFIIPKLLTDPVWYFYLIWLPDFFKQSRGLDIKHSWTLLVTIYSIVTVIGIAGGGLSGFLTRRGLSLNMARKAGMLLFALCVLPVLAITGAGDWPAVLLIGLAGGAHQAWSATLFTTVSDTFPDRSIASVIGIGNMAGAAGGIIFPIVTGMMIDHYKALGCVSVGYGILFEYCAGAYLLAFLFLQLLNPRLQPVEVE